MEPKKTLNELLRECEVELADAHNALIRLMDMQDDYEDEQSFIAECDYLMEKITRLTFQFESLLQSL